MKGILNFLAMAAGGWIGWFIGAPLGLFTAFVVSMVGTGVGLWVAIRFTKAMLG